MCLEAGQEVTQSSRPTKGCSKCGTILLLNGIHMGTPFAYTFNDPKVLVCSKCYDELSTNISEALKE